MFNFNLLPSQKKEKIEKERIYIIVRGILKGFFWTLILILVLLATANFSLKYLISSQEKLFETVQEDKIIKDMLKLDSQIVKENNLIETVYNEQEDLVYLAPIVRKIASLVPENIYLTELTIEKKSLESEASEGNGTEGEEDSEESEEESQEPEGATESESSSSEENPEVLEENIEEKKDYYEVTILGIAAKREDVIALQKSISREPDFVSLVTPLQNILKATEVEFEFSFKVKD